jgi:hypothetical protein
MGGRKKVDVYVKYVVGQGQALFEHPGCRHQVGDQRRVDGEGGEVGRDDRVLGERIGDEGADRVNDLLVGQQRGWS